ncbi:hypothetical protein [Sphingobacterium bovistauri]|uniref:Uncharacterized protein n=1 Tax=Sphingobacterium bovistauri TaxID=2781959 RepID=A0ABS7Z231_9SPHI|nr:hypothetical protein [Sphingobacterium bovistauri]MCA5004234.1 hypothetical protein [Sphingobacterium bovistauri]
MAVILFVIGVWSCKKDEATPTPDQLIQGFWKGKYGNGTDVGNTDIAFKLMKGGQLMVYANKADTAKADKAIGTYFYANGKISGRYTYPGPLTYSFSATLYNDNTAIKGTWGSGSSETNRGNFELIKE